VLATRGKRTAATPVIVRKGALADNVPNQDLHVTKAHGVYIDDALIPVEFLVNHRTILWDDRAQEVEIYHVELDHHDLLLANGMPAESYRDDGNRWLFQNANAGWGLPPQEPCAPVLTGGPVVDAVWRRLLDRAGPRRLPPMTDDPDLHLVVDGERVDVEEQHGPVWVFRLLCCPESVVIASRDAAPAELGLARDPRPLGVALRRIALRRGAKFEVIKANDPRLLDGFHDYETTNDLRWTNGSAALSAGVLAQFHGGGIEIVLTLAGATRYLDDGKSMAAVAAV
jgi:Hint domain